MQPPPSTPTPRRFLLPKRGTQTSSQTPTAVAAHTVTPRFQSTPRFGGSSSSVVKPLGRRALSQEIEDVDEGDDEERVVSSSMADEERVASSSDREEESVKERVVLGDDIVEAENDERVWVDEEVVPGSESPEERRVKRRRVSLDEDMTSSPGPDELPATSSGAGVEQQEDENALGIWSGSEKEEDIDPTSRNVAALQQPTFRPVPRFKPTDGDAAAEGMLPAAFSPQRRGAKYLPGGLAAELQGWLSDVKRWDEDGGGSTGREKFQIHVREVSQDGGGRMYLIKSERGERFVLAGEGRLTGLGRRAVVRDGVVVEVEGPGWEAELEGERWVVCCEWWIG